jgi:BirA family biotin operon repressor/biotin-[acetyl-CoA-carboxylase] ligase
VTRPPRSIRGWRLRRYASLDSTNNEGLRLAEAGAIEGPTLILADSQTEGRGRGSNAWWSDEGSLLFTLVFEPRLRGIATDREPLVALAGARALVRGLGPWMRSQPSIRWPNDVEVEGRKLAGLLCEAADGPDGDFLLLGVGVNVETSFDEVPADVRARATTLAEIAGNLLAVRGARWRRLRALLAFLDEFDEALDALADPPRFAELFDLHDALRDRPVRIRQGDRIVTGVGRGIEPDGALRLETAEGIIPIYGGQVLDS